MKHWTEEQEKKYQERKQWFIDRIGKRVFREETSCQCETCKRVSKEGVVINDEMHAEYLLDIENMYSIEGHKLTYRDEQLTIICAENVLNEINKIGKKNKNRKNIN